MRDLSDDPRVAIDNIRLILDMRPLYFTKRCAKGERDDLVRNRFAPSVNRVIGYDLNGNRQRAPRR